MKKLFLTAAISVSFWSFASAQFLIGYKAGYWNPNEINRVIYLYNTVNNTGKNHIDKEMPKLHLNTGVTIGYSFNLDNEAIFELRWSNKHSVISSHFESGGQPYERDFKVRSNMLEFGFGRTKEHYRYGGSLDLGNFKGWGRKGPESDPGKYVKLFQLDPSPLVRTQVGFTGWFQFDYKIAGIRLYYQFAAMKMKFDSFDQWMLGTPVIPNYIAPKALEDRASNIGLEINFLLGKKYK